MCKLVKITNSLGEQIEVAEIKADTIKKITDESDIDLAIISNVSASKLCNRSSYREFKERLYAIDTDQEYDRLQFNSLKAMRNSKEPVCLDIISKGKLLYQREGISYV